MGRLQLQSLLENLDGGDQDPAKKLNVYFQPPANVQMVYPCIVYKRDRTATVFADNSPYRSKKGYMVTVIDRNPDSAIPDLVAKMPLCSHDRTYTAESLNHDVFTLYF